MTTKNRRSAWIYRTMLAVLTAGTAVLAQAADPPPAASPAAAPPAPPNLVPVSERLTTSGQPSAAWLETVKAQGFEAVVYLAPPSVPDAVANEAVLVGRQGLIFVNVPVAFGNPTEADFMSFAKVMDALQGKKVLVHCQVNMRASTFTFLYRVIHRKENPGTAYDLVSKVWTPQGPWKRLVQEQLKKHGVDFEPL